MASHGSFKPLAFHIKMNHLKHINDEIDKIILQAFEDWQEQHMERGKLLLEHKGETYDVEVWTGTDLDTYWLPQDQIDLLTGYFFNYAPEAPKSAATVLKEHEDKVVAALDGLDEVEKWIAFKYLYNTGKRIADAERELRKLLKAKKD